jgi:hypothetical protein
MKRDEIVALRKELFSKVEGMRYVGDYGAGARDIRETAEVVLKLVDHLLERMRA